MKKENKIPPINVKTIVPYDVENDADYLREHDRISDIDTFREENYELSKRINQIIGLKKCSSMLRQMVCCESLPVDLRALRLELIQEVKNKYGYVFDDDWPGVMDNNKQS